MITDLLSLFKYHGIQTHPKCLISVKLIHDQTL